LQNAYARRVTLDVCEDFVKVRNGHRRSEPDRLPSSEAAIAFNIGCEDCDEASADFRRV